MLAIPLRHENAAVGALVVARVEVLPFTPNEIRLLEAFADQAAIAIENTRLFQELQERTAQLARSVEEQRALAEVSQTVSSSLDLQEVLTTVVAHATRLADADAGTIYELDADTRRFVRRALYQMPAELIAAADEARPTADDDSVLGQAARAMAPLQIADLADVEGRVDQVGAGVSRGRPAARLPGAADRAARPRAARGWHVEHPPQGRPASSRRRSWSWSRHSPASPSWRSRTPGSSSRSRRRAGRWKRPASTSRSSWRT